MKKKAEQKEEASRKRKETGEPGKKKKVLKQLKLTEEEEKARQDEQNKIAEQAKQQENKLIETNKEKDEEEKEKQKLETERIERERAEAEQKAQKDKEEREKEAEARKAALDSIDFDKPLESALVKTPASASTASEGKDETPAGDGKAKTPAGDGKAETPAGDPQKDKKPDPATLCDGYYCRKTSNIRTPLDYRTPGTVKGEQQSRATTAILESMVCKNMKNLALYPKKIAITREGEDVWVVGVQSKLSKQFLNKGGRDITDLQKIILISRRVVAADGTKFRQLQSCGQTVIDPIASELVGDVPDDEWDPEVPPLLVLMAPASQTPLEKLPVIYDFAWMQEQPGNGGTYVNGRARRQMKPKPEPEAEPVSLTPPKAEHVEITDSEETAGKENDTALINVLNTLSQTMLDVPTEIELMKQTQSTIPEQNKLNEKNTNIPEQNKLNEVEKKEKVESVRFAQQAQQIAELQWQKTVEALQSKVQPTPGPAITLLDQDTPQLTTLTTNSSASSFNTSNARQKLYHKLGNQFNNVNSQNMLQYHLMIEQQLLQ
eukprot:g1424.t1